ELGERELGVQVVAQRRRVGRGEALLIFFVALRAAPVGDIGRPLGVGGGRRFGARFGRTRGDRRGGRVTVVSILTFERRVVHQQAVDLLIQFDRRELQQPDRLLQLRRQREVLRKSELQGRFHQGLQCAAPNVTSYMRKFSPT